MLRADDFQIFLEVARRGRLIEAARVLKINHTTAREPTSADAAHGLFSGRPE